MLGIMDNLRYNGLYHSSATRTRRSSRMRVKLQLVICNDEGHEETVTDVITLNKNNQRIEQLGLTLAEAKQLLSTLQRHLLQQQVATFLDTCSTCAACGALLKMKAHASRSFRTLFGTFTLDSPRLEHCDCTRHQTSSFRPLSALLPESVAPELLYMEAKWSSLVSYGMNLDALKDFLPLEVTLDVKTVRYDQGHSVFQLNTNEGQCQVRLGREAAARGCNVGVACPSQQPNRSIAQCCHPLGNVPTADLRTIFLEGHIANPMQSVLNLP